jgi:hypothetical protein
MSSSKTVPVALIELVTVLVERTVAIRVKVSVGSTTRSFIVGTETATVVVFAGITTVVATAVKSEEPAVPVDVTILIIVGTVVGELKVITNIAALPSITIGLAIVTVGTTDIVRTVTVAVAVSQTVGLLT